MSATTANESQIGDGSKAIQVGTRIAVTAEPGDDLASLEIPKEESPAPKKEAEAPKQEKKESQSVPREERTSKPAKSETSKASSGKASKQTYPLYPSVQHLLQVNGLPKEEADKIPATGPNGRLLKGDVLAYVGQIEKSYPSELASGFTKRAHLDLSNIKPMAKKLSPKAAAAPEALPIVDDLPIELTLPISLTAVMECQKRVKDSIGVFLPLSTFVARATELANEDLPKSKLAKPSADELFNAVLGLDKVAGRYSRGRFVPQVTTLAPTSTASKRVPVPGKSDILDILAGQKSKSSPKARSVAGPLTVFSVSVPKGDVKRGGEFLKRVKTVLEVEPGRLVV
jgi:hypothetical protein